MARARNARPLTGPVAGALGAFLLVGCGEPRPPDAELAAASDEARATVIAIADEAGEALTNGSEAAFRETTSAALGEACSWDGSDSPAATGEAIQWAADRQRNRDSGESTADLLDPIVEDFIGEGWELTTDDPEGRRFVRMDRDGFMLQMSGASAARSGQATQHSVTAYAPRLLAPETSG